MTDKEKLRDIFDKAGISCYESKTQIIVDAYDRDGDCYGDIVFLFGDLDILIKVYSN